MQTSLQLPVILILYFSLEILRNSFGVSGVEYATSSIKPVRPLCQNKSTVDDDLGKTM